MLDGVISKIVGPVFGVIDKMVVDKDEQNRLKVEIQAQILSNEAEIMSYARDVIVSETGGKGLKAAWRPIFALSMTAIIVNNYILAPYLQAMFGWSVDLEPPPQLWDLMSICLGGYVASRGIQAIVPPIADAIKTRNTG